MKEVKLFFFIILLISGTEIFGQDKNPQAPLIPEADGFVIIPHAYFPPDGKRIYKAIYDATKAAKEPSKILPGVNNAGAVLNDLAVSHISIKNAKFIIVFHGAAIFGILDDEHYKAKFGVANPNLPVLSKLKKAGVKMFVCGQNMLSENIDPKNISKDVAVASDALIVLITYQNDGYALMNF